MQFGTEANATIRQMKQNYEPEDKIKLLWMSKDTNTRQVFITKICHVKSLCLASSGACSLTNDCLICSLVLIAQLCVQANMKKTIKTQCIKRNQILKVSIQITKYQEAWRSLILRA